MSKKIKEPKCRQLTYQRNKSNTQHNESEDEWAYETLPAAKTLYQQNRMGTETVHDRGTAGGQNNKGAVYNLYQQEDEYFSDLTIDNIYFNTKKTDSELQDITNKSERECNSSSQSQKATDEKEMDKHSKQNRAKEQSHSSGCNVEQSEKKVMKFLKYTLRNTFYSTNSNPVERQRALTQAGDTEREYSPISQQMQAELKSHTESSNLQQQQLGQSEYYPKQKTMNQENMKNTGGIREEHLYHLSHAKRDIKISTMALQFQNQTSPTTISCGGGLDINSRLAQQIRRKSLYSNNSNNSSSINNSHSNNTNPGAPQVDMQASYMQKFFIPKLRLSCQSNQQGKKPMTLSQSLNRIRANTINTPTTTLTSQNAVTKVPSTSTSNNRNGDSHANRDSITQKEQPNLQMQDTHTQQHPDKLNLCRAINIKEVELCLPSENSILQDIPPSREASFSNKQVNINQPFSTFYVSKQTKRMLKENMYLPQKKEFMRNTLISNSSSSNKENSFDQERRSFQQASQLSHRDLVSSKSPSSSLHQQKQFQINKLTFQKNPFFYQSVRNNPSLINYIETTSLSKQQSSQQQQQQYQQQQLNQIQYHSENQQQSDKQKSYSVNSLTTCGNNKNQNQTHGEMFNDDNQQKINEENMNQILKETDMNSKSASSNYRQYLDNQFKKQNKNQQNIQSIILPLKSSDSGCSDQQMKALNISSLSRLSNSGERGNQLLKKQFKRTLNISKMNNNENIFSSTEQQHPASYTSSSQYYSQNQQSNYSSTQSSKQQQHYQQQQQQQLQSQKQQQQQYQQSQEKLNIIAPLKQLKMIYQPFQINLKNLQNQENKLNFYG